MSTSVSFNVSTGELIFNNKYSRIGKGKSIIASLKDYCVIDTETTGYSPLCDNIIEVAALKFREGKLVDTFSSLVKPDDFEGNLPYLEEDIIKRTGITDEMLSTANDTKTVLSKFMDFIGNDVLVGHSINFDINFLYDSMEQYFNTHLSNNFVDTLRIARRLLPNMPSHRLPDLVEHYNCERLTFHRSLPDAQMTSECYLKLIGDVINLHGSIEEFGKLLKPKPHKSVKVSAKDISASSDDFDISHPLYGKVCVFTGTLEQMVRKDAMQIVANFGGQNADTVTRKTNYLIMGNNDYCKSIKDGKSKKQKKAEKLKLEGYDIEIIPENVFYDMVIDN